MDHLRAWISQHSNLVSWLGVAGIGVLFLVRVRRTIRSAGAPVRIPTFLTGPEPQGPFARVLWRLNEATRVRPTTGVVGRALRFGLAMAFGFGLFSIPILIEVAFRGRYYECGYSHTQVCDWLSIALINPVAAGLMGAILGTAQPLMRRLSTAIPVGIVAAIPFVAQFAIPARMDLSKWSAIDTVLVLAGSIFGGSFLGYSIWKRQATTAGAYKAGAAR